MIRFYLFILLIVVAPLRSVAQRDDRTYDPAVDYYRQMLNEQVMAQMNKIDWNKADRRTSGGTVLYTIPVVVHVVHNYGPELIPDNTIYNFIDSVNSLLLMTNSGIVDVIDKYKPVAASTQIALKLATKDAQGNPTKGVEHINSYLTNTSYTNVDQSKVGQWPQDKYLNIWIVNNTKYVSIGEYGASYYTPFQAAYIPYYDGVVLSYNSLSATDARYIARYLNLPYPCGPFSYLYPTCTDADGIPDTPPCIEYQYIDCTHIYDTSCDTPNNQNIMFTSLNCGLMFTYGQAQYMQYILQIDIGKRDSLVTANNFSKTGMDQPMPDLLPEADFAVKNNFSQPVYFFTQNQNVVFTNTSWNDTITGASWTFSNDAMVPSSTSLTTVINKFSLPGWVSVTLASSSNTGTSFLTNEHALYIADSIATNANGYFQEFNARKGDLDKWPMFNYFRNEFKWQLYNTGFYDHTCISYRGFDSRTYPENLTGTPAGDYDDLFSPVFDLTGFSGNAFLNFMSAGATATSNTRAINDTLEIDYSTNLGAYWQVLKTISGQDLANNGTLDIPYAPLGMGEWVPRAIPLPPSLRTRQTIFRFRYHPGADSSGHSTGNNFYLDRINFGEWPQSIPEATPGDNETMLYPNPTQHTSAVMIREQAFIHSAMVTVTDLSGRVVYKVQQQINGNTAVIDLPEHIITVKGMYLVHVVTDRINRAMKLVVY